MDNTNDNTLPSSNKEHRYRINLLALPNASHLWLRELSRWVNGSVLDANLAVVLSVEEVDEQLDQFDSFSMILIDDSNSKAIEALRRRDFGSQTHITIIGNGELQPREPGTNLSYLQFPFTASELTETAQLAQGRQSFLPITTSNAGDEPQRTQPFDSLDLDELRKSTSPGAFETLGFSPISPNEFDAHATGRMIGLIGVPGSGTSTLSMALAQLLGTQSRVLLVDLCADGDLSMYHDIDRSSPGLGELMSSAMKSGINAKYLRSFYHPVVERNYQLLPGIKRQEEVLTFRSSHLEGMFSTISKEFDYVIFDMDSSLRSPKLLEASTDPSTTTASEMILEFLDAVAVTLSNDLRGIHSGLRLTHRLLSCGFSPQAIAMVIAKSARRHIGSPGPTHSNLNRLANEIASEFSNPATNGYSLRPKTDPSKNTIEILVSNYDRNMENIHESVKPIPKHLGESTQKWINARLTGRKENNRNSVPSNKRILPGDLAGTY